MGIEILISVEQGGALVGIIGKNRSRKKHFLAFKLLSRVTTPTAGTIKSTWTHCIVVGSWYRFSYPQENIWNRRCHMGMTKLRITRKLDEIVDFAGVGVAIDTPVKRYSSGRWYGWALLWQLILIPQGNLGSGRSHAARRCRISEKAITAKCKT